MLVDSTANCVFLYAQASPPPRLRAAQASALIMFPKLPPPYLEHVYETGVETVYLVNVDTSGTIFRPLGYHMERRITFSRTSGSSALLESPRATNACAEWTVSKDFCLCVCVCMCVCVCFSFVHVFRHFRWVALLLCSFTM